MLSVRTFVHLILYKYFTKDIFKYFLLALFSLMILIFFLDIIELFRRSSNKVGVDHLVEADIFDILVMALLKISGNIQKILPFAVLIGSISCFNQWRKKNYYIVSKTSGISLWTILSPILISFFLIGLVSVIVLNPLTALLNKKYENLQTVFFGQKNLKTFSFDTKGFWIKQISRKSYLLINAGKINEDLNTLFDVLFTMVRVMAPFTPFLTEHMYQNLKNFIVDDSLTEEQKRSVHFLMLPKPK